MSANNEPHGQQTFSQDIGDLGDRLGGKPLAHDEAQKLFAAYWDYELDDPTREALEQHLSECGQCRAEYERYDHTLRILHNLPSIYAPIGFLSSVQNRIRRRSKGRFFPVPARMTFPYEGFAAVILGVLAAIYIYHLPSSPAPRSLRPPLSERLVQQTLDICKVHGKTSYEVRPDGTAAVRVETTEGEVVRLRASLTEALRQNIKDIRVIRDGQKAIVIIQVGGLRSPPHSGEHP